MPRLTMAELRKQLLELGMEDEDLQHITTREDLEQAYSELSSGSKEEKDEDNGEAEEVEEEGWKVGDNAVFQEDPDDDDSEWIAGEIIAISEDGTTADVRDSKNNVWELSVDDLAVPVIDEDEESGEESSEEVAEESEIDEPEDEEKEEAEEEIEEGSQVTFKDDEKNDVTGVVTDFGDEDEDGVIHVVTVEEENGQEWEIPLEEVSLISSEEVPKEEEPEEEEKPRKRKSKPAPAPEEPRTPSGRHPRDPTLAPRIREMRKKGMKAREIAYTIMGCENAVQAREQDASRYSSIYHRVFALDAKDVLEKKERQKAREAAARKKGKGKAKPKAKAKAKPAKPKAKAKQKQMKVKARRRINK